MLFVWLTLACLILGEIIYRVGIRVQAKHMVNEIESALANDTN